MNFSTTINHNWFVNLTDTDIPQDVSWLLSLGPKFAVPIKQNKFPLLKIIADVENVLTMETDEHEKDVKRSKVSHLLNKRKFSNTIKCPVDVEITKIYNKTKNFCNQHKGLFTLADKGNRTIVMYRSDYERRMFDLLSDGTTYKRLNHDTTDALHARLVHIATTFKRMGKRRNFQRYRNVQLSRPKNLWPT